MFLKLSVAVFDNLKALWGLRHGSVIWYSARMYLGSPGSDGVGGFVVCELLGESLKIDDIPTQAEWGLDLDSTIVHVERVIGYWSCTFKPAE